LEITLPDAAARMELAVDDDDTEFGLGSPPDLLPPKVEAVAIAMGAGIMPCRTQSMVTR